MWGGNGHVAQSFQTSATPWHMNVDRMWERLVLMGPGSLAWSPSLIWENISFYLCGCFGSVDLMHNLDMTHRHQLLLDIHVFLPQSAYLPETPVRTWSPLDTCEEGGESLGGDQLCCSSDLLPLPYFGSWTFEPLGSVGSHRSITP